MQTFLPSSDFVDSARVLDDKRLRKQCVESIQIIDTISNNRKAWRNHPAVRMWENSVGALCIYTICMCDEHSKRFGKPIRSHKYTPVPVDMREIVEDFFFRSASADLPLWMQDSKVCTDVTESHRSNLLRKDRVWYSQFNWGVPDDLPYVWPV